MLAEGAIHLTGLLLLAPHLTPDGHAVLLARARFRTKREIECLVAEIAPRPDIAARVEPLGLRPTAVTDLWQAYTASLRGPVRDLSPGVGPGHAPPAMFDESDAVEHIKAASVTRSAEPELDGRPRPARSAELADVEASEAGESVSKSRLQLRYRIEFAASQEYVDRLEEARNLLQHQLPSREIAQIHERAMAFFVEHLRKRRQAAVRSRFAPKGPVPERASPTSGGPAPARVVSEARESAPERVVPECGEPTPGPATSGSGRPALEGPRRGAMVRGRYVPVALRRAIWKRDLGRCTFKDARGHRCRERAGLEIHHEHAFAFGGASSLDNLRLLCRAHNALLAERDFGREHMVRVKRGR
jgi:5-methylcytosine-specific restriction endonuclease McrA